MTSEKAWVEHWGELEDGAVERPSAETALIPPIPLHP